MYLREYVYICKPACTCKREKQRPTSASRPHAHEKTIVCQLQPSTRPQIGVSAWKSLCSDMSLKCLLQMAIPKHIHTQTDEGKHRPKVTRMRAQVESTRVELQPADDVSIALTPKNLTCINADECELGVHSCAPIPCVDTVGSFECEGCLDGYERNGTGTDCIGQRRSVSSTYLNCARAISSWHVRRCYECVPRLLIYASYMRTGACMLYTCTGRSAATYT